MDVNVVSGVDTDVFRVHSAHSATVFSTKKAESIDTYKSTATLTADSASRSQAKI